MPFLNHAPPPEPPDRIVPLLVDGEHFAGRHRRHARLRDLDPRRVVGEVRRPAGAGGRRPGAPRRAGGGGPRARPPPAARPASAPPPPARLGGRRPPSATAAPAGRGVGASM